MARAKSWRTRGSLLGISRICVVRSVDYVPPNKALEPTGAARPRLSAKPVGRTGPERTLRGETTK